MSAAVFAWLMCRAGIKSAPLQNGPVRERLESIINTHAPNFGFVPVVVFESPVLEGFIWQFLGLRVMGLSSGLVRRFLRTRGNCPEFVHVVRHELEHCRRRHGLNGAFANALVMFGGRLKKIGQKIIAALEEEADRYE